MEGHGASSGLSGAWQLRLVLQVGLPDHTPDLADLRQRGDHLI